MQDIIYTVVVPGAVCTQQNGNAYNFTTHCKPGKKRSIHLAAFGARQSSWAGCHMSSHLFLSSGLGLNQTGQGEANSVRVPFQLYAFLARHSVQAEHSGSTCLFLTGCACMFSASCCIGHTQGEANFARVPFHLSVFDRVCMHVLRMLLQRT
jgi:hypothetical protein